MKISSWSNYLYNLNNSENTIKAIAFYKPILTINNNQYAKLGDFVSVNTDYSLPNTNQFTLLLKKINSDIKAPINFDLIVNTNVGGSANASASAAAVSGEGSGTNNNYLHIIA